MVARDRDGSAFDETADDRVGIGAVAHDVAEDDRPLAPGLIGGRQDGVERLEV